MRKIIQFAIAGHENYLMALCNDGTLWEMGELTKGKWARLQTIPEQKEGIDISTEASNAEYAIRQIGVHVYSCRNEEETVRQGIDVFLILKNKIEATISLMQEYLIEALNNPVGKQGEDNA